MSAYNFDIDFVTKMNYYAITQLRVNEDYKNLCEVIGNDFNDLKTVSEYILKSIDIETANGVWLDYLGWLVGTSRGYFDITDFFCVNADDVNEEKYFYFPNSSNGEASLSDDIFRKRIKAKIAYNTSTGTRNENNEIIKNITNATRVIIKRVEPMVLNITLIGNNILESFATRTQLEKVLTYGIGIKDIEIQGE